VVGSRMKTCAVALAAVLISSPLLAQYLVSSVGEEIFLELRATTATRSEIMTANTSPEGSTASTARTCLTSSVGRPPRSRGLNTAQR
jgi:hypothetical protein